MNFELKMPDLSTTGSPIKVLRWLTAVGESHFSLDAAQQLAKQGVDAEVTDVRSLAPLDFQTFGNSLKKTVRVLIVEEGPKTGSVSAEIAAGLQERFGHYLKAPIMRVASPDVPVPFSPALETAYLANVPQIIQAACRVLGD